MSEEKRSRKLLKIVLPILVLAVGAAATAALVSSRKAPERVEKPRLGPLVEVVSTTTEDVLVEVSGQGEVSPKTRVDLAPQVGGQVIFVHPSLVSGGRFAAGTTLLEIDPRDYELAVERARSSVASAETTLERLQAEADAAREEWRDLNGDAEPPALLVREPDIREAQARLAAAEADLATAELHLERTRLALPWDGLVLSENVDPGQLLMAGQAVATVVGTKAAEIRVPLDDRELAFLDGLRAGQGGAAATVQADFAGGRHAWQGRVDRLEAQVDARSRMIHVVVTVEDPFAATAERPALLPGTFVDVSIEGRLLAGVVTVPRHALRHGALEASGAERSHVWVAIAGDGDGHRLEVRPVEVVRRERERALVRSGLEPGELVITSSLDAMTDGMIVRIPKELRDSPKELRDE